MIMPPIRHGPPTPASKETRCSATTGPRLHAALNDLPAALLLVAALFELLALATRKESFRQVSFWTLIVGALGGGAAVLSGLQAEENIAHGDAVHRVMETHELLAFITLGDLRRAGALAASGGSSGWERPSGRWRWRWRSAAPAC